MGPSEGAKPALKVTMSPRTLLRLNRCQGLIHNPNSREGNMQQVHEEPDLMYDTEEEPFPNFRQLLRATEDSPTPPNLGKTPIFLAMRG